MQRFTPALLLLAIVSAPVCATAADAQPAKKYFAHPVVEDRDGVIAPWYHGQNGQCDFRIRIAAETLKRYPWADKPLAITPAPISSTTAVGASSPTAPSSSTRTSTIG